MRKKKIKTSIKPQTCESYCTHQCLLLVLAISISVFACLKGCLETLDECNKCHRRWAEGIMGILVIRVISIVGIFLTSAQSRVCDGGVQMVIIAAMFKSSTAI